MKFYKPLKRIYNLMFSQKKYLLVDSYDNCLPPLFQKRRNINLNMLKKIDLLLAVSKKVNDIYNYFLKTNNIITLNPTVKHLNYIFPKEMKTITFPIKFFTLDGCASMQKGSKLMFETLKILNSNELNSYFEFHIWGELDKAIKDILKYKNVYYHSAYNVKDLNYILEKADVGIVPSICEEAYGFVGIEFLAKGIPVIGNKKGGIIDYTIDNFTGWVNKSAIAEELANIVEGIIKNPKKILELNENILHNRNKIIKTEEQHFYEIKDIYENVINNYNEP